MLIRLRRFLGSAIGLGLLALCVPDPLGAESQTKSYPVSLQLLTPSSGGKKVPTVPNVTLSGWSIVLKMSAINEIGIGTLKPGPLFPKSGDQGFVVFEEPTAACHSWSGDGCPVDETYLTFTPGGCSGGQLPGAVPSLVLLADSRGGANLADQFTGVGYELDDTNHQTTVVASLVVPDWFFRAPPLVDLCVGELLPSSGPCLGGALGSVDSSGPSLQLEEIAAILNQNNITILRAFVVSGRAPQFLNDLDGDGVIGVEDAELAGFRVLSREVVSRVRTFYQVTDFSKAPVPADLDGNGLVTCAFCNYCRLPGTFCNPGGGGLTPVPR